MKWCGVLMVALLQSLCCSGLPLYQSELASTADKALVVTMTQVNNLYAGLRLYRVSRGSIKRVVPLGLNTYDLIMNFGIKETDCLKSSGEDPQRCAFRVGFFVPAASCTARVRVTAEFTQVVSLNCGQDSSSSESSSEENFTRKRQQLNVQPFGNRGPVLPVPGFSEATRFPSHSFSRQEVEPQPIPRGDSFGNHLE
ncbi:secreted phosphoprotein 24 precursor [Salmo salar]|uniref:Secreted phosphoprotein 24 n=2 Tax=Salmo salar TaxID=8030 RepID=SPP24_SALSA|nr:secreted phosphoprotein 24 precursor [Salmo salar]Q710A1.1 RecName: Full=Secreted phosphoprotein 24; Short=Spp-24; AltName: Full=Secreted phosphoprotein 2; Flags: Precursor [Salmo salar]CAD21625.1 secreted phosphoprotein 24 [Salmo salar]|eukprot:NP_001117023.1 secreted phosphoprotein 24 precursor [Salmo salar]